MWAVEAIAGIIGLVAISCHRLCHYLTSTESHTEKAQFEDKNQNNARCAQEAMMSNSEALDAFDVLDYKTIIIMWAIVTIARMIGWAVVAIAGMIGRAVVTIAGMIGLVEISRRCLHRYLTSSESHIHKLQSEDKNQNEAGCAQEAMMSNFDAFDVLVAFSTLFELFKELRYHETKDMTLRMPRTTHCTP